MRKTIYLLIAVILMDILLGMEFDLYTPSSAQIQHYFHITPFWVAALISSNFIGYLLSLFVVGNLSDKFGRKKVILYGMVIFIIGSICCTYAMDYWLLLLGRFLQGIGIAAPAILSFLLIADRYPLKQQQFYMAMLNVVLNISAALAPVVGSYITLYFHWRANFLVLFMLGIITFISVMLFVPANQVNAQHEQSTWSYAKLLKVKTLLLLLGYIVLMATPYWVFVGIMPLLYIKSLHVSLHVFGYYQGILAFTFAVGNMLIGFVIQKYTQRQWLFMGVWLFVLALIAMIIATFFENKVAWFITLAMLIYVIAQVIPSVIIYPLCLNYIPQAKGKIAAMQQGSRLIFASIVLQIVGYFYHGTFLITGVVLVGFMVAIIIMQLTILNNKSLQLNSLNV